MNESKSISAASDLHYGLNRQSPMNAVRRHWVTLFRYNSLKKMTNLLLVATQYFFKKTPVRGYPVMLKVEPTSRCNLRCPGCTAHGTDFPIEEGDMELSLFQKICDEFGDYLYKISLYITGEPLLNKQLIEMITYASSKNIGTVISTNFHAFNEDKAEQIIDAGLSHIIVCLDGVTQEVYGSYRVGGHVEQVKKNLEILTRKKKEKGSSLPFIEVQTVRNEFNQQEIPQIRALASELGVDRYTIREDLRNYKTAERDHTCFWLWCTALVTEQGDILPCCASAWWTDEKRKFGNIKQNSFSSIWNNSKYQQAREVFQSHSHLKDPAVDNANQSLCATCTIFRCPRAADG